MKMWKKWWENNNVIIWREIIWRNEEMKYEMAMKVMARSEIWENVYEMAKYLLWKSKWQKKLSMKQWQK